jgi:UrcA family protein
MLLLGCTVSWAAGADDARAVPAPAAIVHLRVPLRGVDLYSASGVASFYRRLERAAKRACDYGNIPGYYDKHCAADALDRAVAGRGVPALDRLHAERTRDRGPRRDPEVVRLVCGSDRPLERVCGP